MAKNAKARTTPATDAGTLELIPLSLLAPSPRNMRKTNPADGIEALADSILASGGVPLQNLTVTAMPDGDGYHVEAGERRRLAMRLLAKKKKIPADHPVPCRVIPIERAVAATLTENENRKPAHPADQFEAFAAYIDAGNDIEATAAQFGVSPRFVNQRMKLARLAPELIATYRAGELTLEQLEAFTLTDDHEKQRAVLAAVLASNKHWERHGASYVREALDDETKPADGQLGKFVGIEAYRQAGGRFSEDLFAEEDDGDGLYLVDAGLLKSLAADRLARELEAHRDALLAEGWGWVEAMLDSSEGKFGMVKKTRRANTPEELARIEAIEAELEKLDDLDERTEAQDAQYSQLEEEAIDLRFDVVEVVNEKQKPLAGVVLSVGWDGDVLIERGLIRPEDKKAAAALVEKPKREPAAPRQAPPANDSGTDDTEDDETSAFRRMYDALIAVKEVLEAHRADRSAEDEALLGKVRAAIAAATDCDIPF